MGGCLSGLLDLTKSLFGHNGSVPFPHTNGLFPSVSKQSESDFHSRNGDLMERSYFC